MVFFFLDVVRKALSTYSFIVLPIDVLFHCTI